MKSQRLVDKVQHVKRVFDIDQVLQVNPSAQQISRYYKINRIAYSLFHSHHDFIHMGISRHGSFSQEDLIEPVKLVENYLKPDRDSQVLELATGRGANSAYLADRHPEIKFTGLDLPGGHIDSAINRSHQLRNFHVVSGDYHDLSLFAAQSFDVVFVIEALCYSQSKKTVMQEVARILKPSGIFIIIDGYQGKPDDELNQEERLASLLAGKGMWVAKLEEYRSVQDTLRDTGFTIIYEEDVSLLTLPTLERFEWLADLACFRYPLVGRLLSRVLPPEFMYNAISGYLLPDIIRSGVGIYMITVAEKPHTQAVQ